MCGKSRSELEMRPLVNVDELKAGNIIGECKEEGEREIGGGQVNVVCRHCWLDLLGTKTREEIIEIFETICGLLFEIDRRYKEEKKQTLQIGGSGITWDTGTGNQYTIPATGATIWKTGANDGTFTINSTSDQLFTTSSTSMSSGTLFNLGNQWEELTDDSDTEEE
jgi:hypothetical protein